MNKYLVILSIIFFGCNSKESYKENKTTNLDCNDEWSFENSNVIEKQINDTITQEIIDGKVWFEIIAPRDKGNGTTKAYIKNYRMDGSLLSEGFAEYYEHPVADYSQVGDWKFYDCNGNVTRKPK